MKLKEVTENLVGVATKVTKIGIQEEIRHPKLIRTSTALDLRAIGLAVLHQDLKDDVVIVPESDEGKKDFSVYLVDNELTRKVAEEWYGKQLGKKGLKPIVRTKIIKRDGQDVVVLHVPLLDAQVALAHTDLGTQVPELYCGKTLDKKAGSYLTCGEEIREHYAKYVLGEELSLYEQDRSENSKTPGGRLRNIQEDAANIIKAKVSATGQKLGASAKNKLRQAPVVGLNLAKTTISAIKETPRVARDTIQLGIVGFAIGEAVTESLVEPVLNQALSDVRDKAIAVKDKVAALPKSPTDIVATVIIKQLKNPKS